MSQSTEQRACGCTMTGLHKDSDGKRRCDGCGAYIDPGAATEPSRTGPGPRWAEMPAGYPRTNVMLHQGSLWGKGKAVPFRTSGDG